MLYNIISFQELDSTNTYAMRNISTLNDKDVIVANTQTAGHGRFNRMWHSQNTDNIYATIVLKPTGDIQSLPLSNLTHYLAVKITEVLESYGITNSKIKWPNDVKIDDAKISGILSQTSFTGMNFNGIVLGFGINLNMTQQSLAEISQKATSLNIILGRQVDKYEFLTKLLDTFFAEYDTFLSKGFPFIKEKYQLKCCSINQNITIHTIIKNITGFAKGIDESGALVLETPNGEVHLTEGES